MEQERKVCGLKRYSDSLIVQALRYGLAAALGFAVDYGLLALMTGVLRWHYLLSVPLAFIAGMTVNYLVGVAIVFRRGRQNRAAELSGFLLVALMAIGMTELCMYLLTGVCGLHMMVSRLLTGAVTFVYNFLMRRFVLYGKKQTKQ